MSNNIDLSAELLSMIVKVYPNGSTLTVSNGTVEVKLPQVTKKVIPALVKKRSHGNVKYISDAQVYSDGNDTFYFSSDEYSIQNMSICVQDGQRDHFLEMLRDGEGMTEEVSLEVEVIYQEGRASYANFIS